MATIKEIAELAGVSRGTVDRVLNHRGSVKTETAEKIMGIATTLNYRPNKAGLALAVKKRKYKIGVILFGEQNPFFDEVVEGLQFKALELKDYGVTISVKRVKFDLEAQLHAIEELIDEGVHALIIAPYNHMVIKEKINQLVEKKMPVITINTDVEDTDRLVYVGSDYYQGGRIAAGLLAIITQGNIELGIVTGSDNVLCHSERIRGLRDVLEANCSRIKIVEIAENHDDEFESYTLTKRFLDSHPNLDALFFVAAGVYGGCRAVEESGKRPKIITFDEIPSTLEMLQKGIITATIGQQAYYQGIKSLEIIFEFLTSETLPESDKYIVEHTIKIKESVL